jgi:hypothetical protein
MVTATATLMAAVFVLLLLPAMVTVAAKRKVTPPELARRWGISADKVVHWIVSGELRAIDASTRRDKRPRYLIDEDDIAAFEAARQVTPPAPAPTRRKRSKLPSGFVRHFRRDDE